MYARTNAVNRLVVLLYIAAMAGVGVLLGASLLLFYAKACAGHVGGICKMVVDSPPWLLVTGLVAAPSVLLTWYWRTIHKEADIYQAEVNIKLATEAHFTERFPKAIEMLGSTLEPVRLGGIYALQRLARDSATDRSTILKTLAAFVRLTSPSDPDGDNAAPGEDVRAAITVLGERDVQGADPINLEEANLIGVPMRACYFKGANFEHALLLNTKLDAAHLEGANLTSANLMHASLLGAHLSRCSLNDADLTSAEAVQAEFRGAFLIGAKLISTSLVGADLTDADLSAANLEGANLEGANLSGTILGTAELKGISLKGSKVAKATLEAAKRSGKPIVLTDDEFAAVLDGALL
jgi:uncharacterized protein YjbI with pentapeptide repeats